MENDVNYLFTQSKPLDDAQEENIIDLAGYQVTKAELFAHTKEPAITVWEDRIKFNMACLRRFPGITHIQLLIHPEQRRMIIRPCDRDAPDSLRWANGGGEKELKNRDMTCRVFAAKLFDLMQWDKQYRYKMLGKPAVCDGEVLFLFKLTDFEVLSRPLPGRDVLICRRIGATALGRRSNSMKNPIRLTWRTAISPPARLKNREGISWHRKIL